MKKFNTEYSIKNINEEVNLKGWASKVRNLGGLIFIDLRDRSGIIQLVINPDSSCYSIATKIKSEYVISVKGVISKRSSINKNIETGEIEVIVSSIEILNKSKEIPFEITDSTTALEDTRLKYRYLDLRRDTLKNKLITRHKITMETRKYLDSLSFLEVETPILCKSTPEGARDYLVPSRVNKGSFYALPQSPQLFKQLLMVGGIERYFQIAKCFRDEDLRADRQPEFTQIDVEMSFVDEEDVMNVCEGLVKHIFKSVKGIEFNEPFMKMKYDDAINIYGSDKPDLRFEMKINDITDILKNNDSNLFKGVIENNGIINCIIAKNLSDKYSRKNLDNLTEFVKQYKAGGLAYLKIADEITGSVSKLLNQEEINELKNRLNLENNDLVLIVMGNTKVVKTSLGALRIKIAKDENLIDYNNYKILWVTDFPSFEWSEEENRFMSLHHPFTMPKDDDVDKLLSDKEHCYSKAYDIVINGYEAGGGSIRIHDNDIQNKMFEALELTKEEINSKFGFFVDALKYGTPPHGGFALGLDRITMLLTNTDNIRDVIAFPKTASASDLMSNCPNEVSNKQLEELGIIVK